MEIGSNIGGTANSFGMSNSVPAGNQSLSPYIGIPIQADGATVYTLLNSIFDPRVLYTWDEGDSYIANYSGLYDYRIPERKMLDLYYYRIFDERPGRQEPSEVEIHEMIDNISDISRMLGIYYTAAAMKESRDPEMYQRARLYELNNTFSEMQTLLSELPCPRLVAQLNAKYIGLMDVATDQTWQNIGFLVNGNYEAFLSLYNSVRSRRRGLRWMAAMYPKLGVLGSPPAKSYDPDFMTVFANANYKLTQVGEVYCPYVTAAGVTQEPMALASAGILHCVEALDGNYDDAGNALRTLTAWAFPGTGIDTSSAIRTPYPFMCKWVNGQDRSIANNDDDGSTTDASTAIVTAAQPAQVQDATLLANIAHEYNMLSSSSENAFNPREVDLDTGYWVDKDVYAPHYVARRMTAGFGLGQLSWKLDANLMSILKAVVSG